MTVVVVLVSALLAGIAAAGVLRPFGARRAVLRLDPQADPMDDERAGLLRALRDLDEERARGALSDEDHRALRTDTERRAVSVLPAPTCGSSDRRRTSRGLLTAREPARWPWAWASPSPWWRRSP
ncbi:MAG: hypothetical protein E6G47_10265 [Actinobacteria bacterium]|nr:MAG: hypothetical protein E6G47_10265 [Actinomycetota bacterium]